jgi:hypothetical protein
MRWNISPAGRTQHSFITDVAASITMYLSFAAVTSASSPHH